MGVRVADLDHVQNDLGIQANPEFAFPRDQLNEEAVFRQFEARLRKLVKDTL